MGPFLALAHFCSRSLQSEEPAKVVMGVLEVFGIAPICKICPGEIGRRPHKEERGSPVHSVFSIVFVEKCLWSS